MQITVGDITAALEEVAPLSLQEEYDNAGLQVGNKATPLTGVLLCLEVTEEVVAEAIALGANLIVSHHPLIFKGLKSLTGRDYVERTLLLAIQSNIALYAAHTNLDNAKGGVNYKLAQKLHLTEVEALQPMAGSCHGSGVVGNLTEPMSELELLNHLKEVLQVPCIKHSPLRGRAVRRIALCGGAGAFLAKEAVACGADLFITGEMKYHDYFTYQKELLLVEAGHYETEQYTKELFCDIITNKFPTFVPYYTKIETNPINYL